MDSKLEKKRLQILVLGDRVRHVLLQRDPLGGPYKAYDKPTGAPLIQKMIECALEEETDSKADNLLEIGPQYPTPIKSGELFTVLDFYPPKSPANERDDKVLRAQSEYYTAPDKTDRSGSTQPNNKSSANKAFKACLEKNGNPDVFVIYDRNSHLRETIQYADDKTKSKFANCLAQSGGVIVAIRDDLDPPEKHENWLTSLANVLSKRPKKKGNPTIVMVHADTLRKCGLNITEYGSLEQAVREVSSHANRYPLGELCAMSSDLIVVFRETGALHLKSDLKGGSLHICPNFDRQAQSDRQRFGIVPGKFTVLLTALVRGLCASRESNTVNDIGAALRLGVAGYNLLFKEGLERKEGSKDRDEIKEPFDAIRTGLSFKRRQQLHKFTEDRDKPEFLLTSLTLPDGREKMMSWSRIESIPSKSQAEALVQIVKFGLETALRFRENELAKDDEGRWFPKALIRCPYAEFGKIKTIDADEIQKFLSFGKLIRKYLDDRNWTEPLCLAVFGKPGSGKSFAVKEILKTVDPGRKGEPLTFNLAQFSSVDQLTEAFHKVQDQALSGSEIPLVIFDEFDCFFENPLGWLKYFLAPMQDGLFRGRTQDYRVGRAIFLFSGGTSDSFNLFKSTRFERTDASVAQQEAGDANGSAEQEAVRQKVKGEEAEAARRKVKLDDFISRLRGHLDVTEINGSNIDMQLMLRRAIVLRSILERHAKQIMRPDEKGRSRVANINDEVINAFLQAKNFVHGVRSMEAIVQMSRLIEGRFVPASLPHQEQLVSHVDLSSFKNILPL